MPPPACKSRPEYANPVILMGIREILRPGFLAVRLLITGAAGSAAQANVFLSTPNLVH